MGLKKVKKNLTVNMRMKRSFEKRRAYSIKMRMIVKLKNSWRGLKKMKCIRMT